MPELDYAMLAEYARAENGKLTVVGASYTHITVPALGAQHLLAIAGRIRAAEDTPGVRLDVTITSAGGEFVLRAGEEIKPASDVRPYDGKVGLLFALTTLIPLPSEGVYWIELAIDGEQVRKLAFDVSVVA